MCNSGSSATLEPLRISCIVEGHGEVPSVPIIVRRIAAKTSGCVPFNVLLPIRVKRNRFIQQEDEFKRVLGLAGAKAGGHGAILILLDSDDDCAKDVAVDLLERARKACSGVHVAVVFAVREFEAWYLAAASSLAGKRGLPTTLSDHSSPESPRDAKGWLSKNMPRGQSYRETIDQPAFAGVLDLDLARGQSPSFDKFCREIEKIIDGALG
jgi:hypothetical protein